MALPCQPHAVPEGQDGGDADDGWGKAPASRPADPVSDRHDDFASTVPLAASRLGIRPVKSPPFSGLAGAEGLLSSSQTLNSSMRSRLTSTRASEADRVSSLLPLPLSAWSSPSRPTSSTCSSRSCGVPVHPASLPRVDGLPDRNSGKRVPCAADRLIRVFVRLPGAGRIGLWVLPDTPVGPASPGPRDRFTDLWGDDAEIRGPYMGRPQPGEDGRLSPLRGLMAQEAGLGGGRPGTYASTAALSCMQEQPSTSLGLTSCSLSPGLGPRPEDSLKGLLEAATGIPVARQKVVFGGSGPLDDHGKALFEYGVGHGALLLLSVRPDPGEVMESPRHNASPVLRERQHLHVIADRLGKFMKRKVGPKKGRDLVQLLPDWQCAKPAPVRAESLSDVPVFDYSLLRDNGIFDVAGRVRKRWGQHARVAKSAGFKAKLATAGGALR